LDFKALWDKYLSDGKPDSFLEAYVQRQSLIKKLGLAVAFRGDKPQFFRSTMTFRESVTEGPWPKQPTARMATLTPVKATATATATLPKPAPTLTDAAEKTDIKATASEPQEIGDGVFLFKHDQTMFKQQTDPDGTCIGMLYKGPRMDDFRLYAPDTIKSRYNTAAIRLKDNPASSVLAQEVQKWAWALRQIGEEDPETRTDLRPVK
jgi:hypothetical protein